MDNNTSVMESEISDAGNKGRGRPRRDGDGLESGVKGVECRNVKEFHLPGAITMGALREIAKLRLLPDSADVTLEKGILKVEWRD